MSPQGIQLHVSSEAETEALGARLAELAKPGMLLCLHGELGVGKTTLVRGFLQALGVRSAVKSPTYTLVEPYNTAQFTVYHFDLYRVNDPQELEEIGIRDYFGSEAVCLIEWPERGAGVLPPCDVYACLDYGTAEGSRAVHLTAHSPAGAMLIGRWLPLRI